MNTAPTVNGAPAQISAGNDDILSRLRDALSVVHRSHSSNQERQQAQTFLEEVKALDEAPSLGFTLAADGSQAHVVRHYGLSLLEHAVKHNWAGYNTEQAQYLRGWVLQLSEGVSREDPVYVRTKVAQLWVEVAKRCWGSDWMDMDELLFRLWQVPDSSVHKEFVLQILEILSDEIFNNNTGDDPVVAIRETVLSKACVEIFTPSAVLIESFPNRQPGPHVRFGQEGWLTRVSLFLEECLDSLKGDGLDNRDIRECAARSLSVLYSITSWALPKAVGAARSVPVICAALAAPQSSVQKAALEALHALYSRTNFTEEEFVELVLPLYNEDFVDLCTRLLEWSTVDPQDIDVDKYQFSKKFAEMISCLGNYLDRRFAAIPSGLNIQAFLNLALRVVESPSLVVSIPVLVMWARLLNNRSLGPAAADTPLIGRLLEACSSRLIRYENLPEGTDEPTYTLLMEDTDTIPERHAFLGNYRRYSSQVIECIVQLKLSEALSHILSQAESAVRSLFGPGQQLDAPNYYKYSIPILKVDAHFTVVESALKGYVKWKGSQTRTPEDVRASATLEAEFEAWCRRLLDLEVEDPIIRKRILQLLVAFSTTALQKNPAFMLAVLEHILLTWPFAQPKHKMLNDAIKELQTESMAELQRLASKMPDHLLEVYDQLESKVQDMIGSGALDEKRQLAYRSFLFIIIHRAARLDAPTRIQRLRGFIEPVKASWTEPSLTQALSSYEGFCGLTALDRAQKYLACSRVCEIDDWGSVDLDPEGLAVQADLEHRQALLPLRSTKSFLTFSVEKVDKNSESYQASCELWQDGFSVILPQLLSLMSYAHASHNPKNWVSLPTEMQSIVNRVMTDRFWQAGISEGSKDDFYARVFNKKTTLEGLASTVRGSVRFVRETCYAIIYCMSRLDHQFYGFGELPGPLANALFADSFCLSPHQAINLLHLVRHLVDHCPIELREHFLPPILAVCFQQMDSRISDEWAKLGAQETVKAVAEELTEEMKAESILRQLTYTAVIMVADFLDPARCDATLETSAKPEGSEMAKKYPSLRKFCLMQAPVAVPLLVFCKNAISMHDGRCCGVVLRVFRSIVPEFQPTNKDDFGIPEETAKEIREFISSEVLQAAIRSLHDPYFVDSQKDLASLIASILAHYTSMTPTARNVLVSLNNVKPQDVDQTIALVSRPGLSSRQQRAFILDLLKDLKGVSISEMGKMDKSMGVKLDRASKRAHRSKWAQGFMNLNATTNHTDGIGNSKDEKQRSPSLEGVSGMFGEA